MKPQMYALDFMKLKGGSRENRSPRASSSVQHSSPLSSPRDSPRDRLSSNLSDLSSVTDVDMNVVTVQLCDFPQRMLLQEGIKACNFCPYCKEMGALCAVSLHTTLKAVVGSNNGGLSPGRAYPSGTLSPRGIIKQMQQKYKGSTSSHDGMEVSMTQQCRNSQQVLLSRGTKLSDFCPLCKLHGVLCAVSVHRKDPREVDDGTFSPLSPRKPLTPRGVRSAPLSPREYHTPPDAVIYTLCDSALNGDRPLSTAFAVSNKYLLSNQHFMSGKMRTSYSIAKSVKSGPNGETLFPEGCRPVKIRCFSELLDSSLLELQEEPFNLVPLANLSLDDMLDQMDLDPEDIRNTKDVDFKIKDLSASEFRTKIRNLSFL